MLSWHHNLDPTSVLSPEMRQLFKSSALSNGQCLTIIALSLVLAMAACVHTNESEQPLSAVVAQAAQTTAPEYQHGLVDLNGDGVSDAVVLLRDPGWCGSGGCTMLILKGSEAGYDVISRSTVTHTPVRVAESTSHGWRDIIVSSDGADRIMHFSGDAYPLNPSMQPEASPAPAESAETVLPSGSHD